MTQLRRRLLPSIGGLVAFESAARHGSFTRAAAELALTQGAVSRQIRQLEEQLAVPLFRRVRQRVLLTDAGAQYLAETRQLLDRLAASTHRVLATGGSAQRLQVAVLPTFGSNWLAPRLPDFARRHPDVALEFATRLVPFDFAADPFDVAIHYGSSSWAGAETHKLMDEEIVPLASPAYVAARKIRGLRDLSRAVLLHQSTRATAWADWFAAAGLESDAALRGPRFDNFTMITEASVAGLGAALLPRFLVARELADGRLTIPVNRPLLSDSAYYLAIPEPRAALPHVVAFREWMVGQARA